MYQTGTVNNSDDLLTVIQTFCTDNGWVLSGSNYLYKGQSNIKLTSSPPLRVDIEGATTSTGVSPSPSYRSVHIDSGNWPITYHLFLHDTPDQVVCVVHYATSKIQVIMFGDIVKLHDSAYVGGNWFFASGFGDYALGGLYRFAESPGTVPLLQISPIAGNLQTVAPTIPFTESISFIDPNSTYTHMHAEIDGIIWNPQATQKITYTDYTLRSLYRSPNSWNNQACLIPMHLQFAMANSLYSYLGYIEHIRFIRTTNYNIGDIVTLGPDKWKVFPWGAKNANSPNGDYDFPQSSHTGTLGFAVRYDGP